MSDILNGTLDKMAGQYAKVIEREKRLKERQEEVLRQTSITQNGVEL